ncbi:MAG: rod shape-determining protein RodA [Flavobacteriales bacterium]|nr:rod shape-determining protein RodA [Flavobacteriales bacterium]
MRARSISIKNFDSVTVILFVILLAIGWANIYAATMTENADNAWSFSHSYTKQLVWIGLAFVIAYTILIIDAKFYEYFAYGLFGFMVTLLVAVLIFGAEKKGARSWFNLGFFYFQPSEFAKFACALAIAKVFSVHNFQQKLGQNILIITGVILAPALLIVLQPDPGSALVYGAFIIVFYREGLPGWIPTSIFSLIILFALVVILRQDKYAIHFAFATISGVNLLISSLALLISVATYVLRKVRYIYLISIITLIFSAGYVSGVNFAFDHLLKDRHRDRLNELFGVIHNPRGTGYNVNQSKIAIGSGGVTGKGFLNGTQTKYDFVPEQKTDFIFCTIGEEWGFLGTTTVLGLFLLFLIRIVQLAERQKLKFARVYGYSVASILFFHLTINIGMTIGLAPVIGIPLPFFSYGGSSLWAFTILIFIFLKFDAERVNVL